MDANAAVSKYFICVHLTFIKERNELRYFDIASLILEESPVGLCTELHLNLPDDSDLMPE